MKLILLLSFLFGISVAHAGPLMNRITQLEELQQRIRTQCLNNPNRAEVRVVINGATLTCAHLVVLANRLRNQLQEDVTELQESCDQNPPGQPQRLARDAAAVTAAVACRPVSTDAQCLPLYACAAFTMTNPLATLIGGAQRLAGNRNSCLARGASAAPGCLQNVVKGIFDSIWGLLSLIWDVGKAAVRSIGEWTGLIRRQERSSSERLMAAQQAGPGFIRRFISNPAQVMNQMITSMFNGIKEAAMNSYGCESWAGAPFVSSCLRPMTNWNCASCQQKLQLMCGVAGFAIGEIGTALLTGGLAAGAKFVAKAAVAGVRAGARASRFSTLARNVVRALPRPPPALTRAAADVAAVAGRALTAAERNAIRAFNALTNNPLSDAIARGARGEARTVAGRAAAAFTLRPAALYLDALERATALGFRSVDGALARTVGGTADAAEIARVANASRPDGLAEVRAAVPPEGADVVTLNRTQVDELAGPAERNVAPRVVDGADDIDVPDAPISLADNVDDVPTPSPSRTPANDNGGLVVSSPEPVAPLRPQVTGGGNVVSVTDNTIAITRTGGSPSTLTAANVNRVAPVAEIRPVIRGGTLTDESIQGLRNAGLNVDELVNPYPIRGTTPDELRLSGAQRIREAEFTRTDLQGRFTQWREAGTYDDIMSTIGRLGTEQEKRRYLAILLNSPQAEVRATLNRLRSFGSLDEAGKTTYFGELDTRVAGIDSNITRVEALPVGIERSEQLASLARQRSALLQERTLLMAGDDLEITNIFSARASNANIADQGRIPHSLDDSFSVDLRVKRNTSACRGSYAGAGSAASQLAGGFLTFCRDTGYLDRGGLQRSLAAPGDRTRAGRSTNGYERFNRFELQSGDQITLGLNGPVTYTDAAQLGTGGLGGGIELFASRSPVNPISLDRLRGSVRVPSCNRADCGRIFAIREQLNPRNLANQSDVGRYLDDTGRRTNTLITELNPRMDEYVRSLTANPDPNLTRFREEFSDVNSALGLRREIELKRVTPVGGLDAETIALRDFTRQAETLGDGVAARIRAQNITDPAEIQRLFREAIDASPLARSHADNIRFIEEGQARLRAGNLSPADRTELLYQLSIRAGQEEDIALAFKTLDYKAGSAAKSVAGTDAASGVSGYIRGLQQNGLAATPSGVSSITPELRRAAGLGDIQRVEEAATVLGRPLTRAQQDAVLRAHDVGAGTGRGYFTYTVEEIQRKRDILIEAGFSLSERGLLIRQGITGSLPGVAAARSAADTFSDARSLVIRGRESRSAVSNIAPGEVRDARLATMRTQFREAADGYAVEGARTSSPQFIGEAWRLYSKAGDTGSAVRMMEEGVARFGMNRPAILQGVDNEIARLTREIGTSQNTALLIERNTLRDARARFAGTTPQVAPTPRPQPAVAEVRTPAPQTVVARAPATLTTRITDDLHEVWRQNFITTNGADATRFKPVPDTVLRAGETPQAALVRLEGEGVTGLSLQDGKLTQNINQPAGSIIPALNARLNGNLAGEYATLVGNGSFRTPQELERATSEVHNIWMRNNEWQRETNPGLFRPYNELTAEEKIKDLDVLQQALRIRDPQLATTPAMRDFRQGLERQVRVEREMSRPVTEFTPRAAQDAANEYRLGTNGKPRSSRRASELYYRATDDLVRREVQRTRGFSSGESRFMDDRNFSNALDESLRSDGSVAIRALDDVYAAGSTRGINAFLAENFQRFNTRNPSPEARANIRRLIDRVKEIQRSDNPLYGPQEQYLRSWSSANAE